ncbi:MAG: UDP-N-acetylmuramoyl-L-alanine--D-glutamate ligase [bacterium]
MKIHGKKISIIGAEKSGLSAAKLVKKFGGIPFVTDFNAREKLSKQIELLEDEKIAYEYGTHSAKVFHCDFIITSPGVPTNSRVLAKAFTKNIKVISELEFASLFCKGKIISITGTNGKTTTTSLCAHTLNHCGVKTYAAGNIGLPLSEIVSDVKENECVALETSSFQLDYMDKFKPFISMILNLTPDHLDRYEDDFEKYVKSKVAVTKNQDANDYFISNEDDFNTSINVHNEKVNRFGFSLNKELPNGSYMKDGGLFFTRDGVKTEICKVSDMSLKGEHNIANTLAVLSAAKILNLPDEKIKESFGNFPGVEHRLEFVREVNGIKFINDSKATNVDSVWYALKSFDEPIILILGGKDKGNNYDQIRDLVKKHVKKIYAIGVSASKVYNYFKDYVPVVKKSTLDDCVVSGRTDAAPNEIVLLSPACASFDMFDNYEHRGRVFKNAVMGLTE